MRIAAVFQIPSPSITSCRAFNWVDLGFESEYNCVNGVPTSQELVLPADQQSLFGLSWTSNFTANEQLSPHCRRRCVLYMPTLFPIRLCWRQWVSSFFITLRSVIISYELPSRLLVQLSCNAPARNFLGSVHAYYHFFVIIMCRTLGTGIREASSLYDQESFLVTITLEEWIVWYEKLILNSSWNRLFLKTEDVDKEFGEGYKGQGKSWINYTCES